MSRLCSPASSSGFADAVGRAGRLAAFALSCLIATGTAASAVDDSGSAEDNNGIRLELTPRVCTLAAGDDRCDAVVTAQWHASKNESLCLLIVGQPQIRQCWENHAEGVYTVRLVFEQDLHVELRDLQLEKVLASEAIAVIKEAIRLRRKRRQPWDILS